MPALNSHTHYQATQSSRTSLSLSKSVSEPTQKRKRNKKQGTTRYIVHGFLTSATTPYTDRYSQLKIESNNMLVYMPLTKQLKVYRYYD